jgi:hypothetical protein
MPSGADRPAVAVGLPPLPIWFWLLPLAAAAAWWPLEPYWQSDDFFAVHYAQHLRAVGADFHGPQYGGPLVGHVANVIAHAANALLVGLLWRRFLPIGAAFAAGLLWALLPSHTGTVQWTVGRVDGHTAVWYLLAVWSAVRAHERRTAGAGSRRWTLL